MFWRAHFHDIVWSSDTRPLELYSGLCSLLWGAWLLLVPGSLGAVNAFRYLNFLPASVWGIAFLGLGVWRFTALGKHSRRMRQAACMGACAAWTLIGVLAIQSNAASPNGGIYLLLAAANFWIWFRLTAVLHG